MVKQGAKPAIDGPKLVLMAMVPTQILSRFGGLHFLRVLETPRPMGSVFALRTDIDARSPNRVLQSVIDEINRPELSPVLAGDISLWCKV